MTYLDQDLDSPLFAYQNPDLYYLSFNSYVMENK